MKITYCTIYKNEEKHLPKWIKSAKALGDEIIAVDTGSSDKSNEILRAAGIEPVYFEWIDDFAAAKNFALDRATGDWIIFMDADEYFKEEDAPKMRAEIERVDKDKNIEIIECDMLNIDEDQEDRLISKILHWRVYRNVPYIRYKGKIHEGLDYKKKSPIKYVHSFIPIYHTGYSTNLYKSKGERNLVMLEREIEAEGGEMSTKMAFYMANTYLQLNDMENTRKCAELALDGTDIELGPMAIKMYRAVLRAEETGENDYNKKMMIIDTGLARFYHPDLLYEKIRLNFNEGRHYECERLSEDIFKLMADASLMRRYESIIQATIFSLHELLADIAYRRREVIIARRNIVESLKIHPRDGRLLDSFIKYFNGEKLNIVEPLMKQIYKDTHKDDKMVFDYAFKKMEYGDVYLKYVNCKHGGYEYNMCKKKYVNAAKSAAAELKKLFKEAAYYYCNDKEGKIFETAVPEEYLKVKAKKSELKTKDVLELSTKIVETSAKLIHALISMTEKEYSNDKTKDLLIGQSKNILKAIMGEKTDDVIKGTALHQIYKHIFTNACHESRARLANVFQYINNEEIKLKVALDYIKRGELPSAFNILNSIEDKNTKEFNFAAGLMFYYNKTYNKAKYHFTKARELGQNTVEVRDFIKWSDMSGIKVSLA